jgi:hypothetical protein
MTLATTPLLQPSAGPSRVETAAELMQQALRQLWAEDRERAADRERARKATDARAKKFLLLAQAKRATREMRVVVPAKFFWDFCAEGLDAMRELANEAKQHGQQMRAQAIENRIDAACAQLDRIQQREASRR